MASAFSHAVVALAIGKLSIRRSMPSKVWWLAILCSILPDVDVLSFAFGIDYDDVLGHRGLTHSLIFAFVLAFVVVRFQFREMQAWTHMWWVLIAQFFLVTASHGLLDAMTNGGLGVAFFAPFDNTRYFLPWRPILVSPIGIVPFFSRYGLDVLISEFVWIWLPAGVVLIMVNIWRRFLGYERSKAKGWL
jgi:inner membrane protein